MWCFDRDEYFEFNTIEIVIISNCYVEKFISTIGMREF